MGCGRAINTIRSAFLLGGSVRDGSGYQNGRFFGNVPKRGGLIFNPEINIVDFVPLNRALSRFFREKIAIQFSENEGELKF